MVIFIVVIAALVVLNVFFVFIIRTLAARVGKFAQNNMLRQSSVFDELIVRKEEAYKKLRDNIEKARAELEALNEESASPAIREAGAEYFAVSQADYKDPDFPEEYREIREHFVFDKKEKLREVMAEIPDEPESAAVSAARRILAGIDADTEYELATLPGGEQYAILQDVFDEDGRALLSEYAEGRDGFEGYDFFSWLRRYVFLGGPCVVVRTAGDDSFDGVDERVKAERDDTLCEGMYVIAHGKMYDFSIRNKEIIG